MANETGSSTASRASGCAAVLGAVAALPIAGVVLWGITTTVLEWDRPAHLDDLVFFVAVGVLGPLPVALLAWPLARRPGPVVVPFVLALGVTGAASFVTAGLGAIGGGAEALVFAMFGAMALAITSALVAIVAVILARAERSET